jgi:hypothetical protein
MYLPVTPYPLECPWHSPVAPPLRPGRISFPGQFDPVIGGGFGRPALSCPWSFGGRCFAASCRCGGTLGSGRVILADRS